MHRTLLTTLMLALVAAAPGAMGANTFVARGSFFAGEPVAYFILDACGNPLQEGVDSSCFALPANSNNKHYSLRATDQFGTVIDASVCFYTADFAMVQCDPWNSRAPGWASYASISSLGGIRVDWTYTMAM